MAKIVSIVDHKGGVGKTTTAASLAGVMSSCLGKKVLLVDLDAQKNLTQTFFDLTVTEFPGDVYDIFSILARRRGDPAAVTLPIVNVRKGIDLVPSSDKVCTLDMNYGSKLGRELPLKKALEGVRDKYDWIFIDSPAQLGIATTNALCASDYAIIPVNCDAYSMGGLSQIVGFIEDVKDMVNPDMAIAGILKTRTKKRRLVDDVVRDSLREEFGGLVFETEIRECTALAQAAFMHTDIYTFSSRSAAADDYTALARELVKRTKGGRK